MNSYSYHLWLGGFIVVVVEIAEWIFVERAGPGSSSTSLTFSPSVSLTFFHFLLLKNSPDSFRMYQKLFLYSHGKGHKEPPRWSSLWCFFSPLHVSSSIVDTHDTLTSRDIRSVHCIPPLPVDMFTVQYPVPPGWEVDTCAVSPQIPVQSHDSTCFVLLVIGAGGGGYPEEGSPLHCSPTAWYSIRQKLELSMQLFHDWILTGQQVSGCHTQLSMQLECRDKIPALWWDSGNKYVKIRLGNSQISIATLCLILSPDEKSSHIVQEAVTLHYGILGVSGVRSFLIILHIAPLLMMLGMFSVSSYFIRRGRFRTSKDLKIKPCSDQ